MRENLLEVRLLPEQTMNVTLNSTHASAFFNLTAVFPSSILSASHTNPNLIIGASVSQAHKARAYPETRSFHRHCQGSLSRSPP
jgi:hypothetical protein